MNEMFEFRVKQLRLGNRVISIKRWWVRGRDDSAFITTYWTFCFCVVFSIESAIVSFY